MPQSRHPRAWVKDTRICKNCGHTRARHGGNIGRGRFGTSVYCIETIKDLSSSIWGTMRCCRCRVFEPEEEARGDSQAATSEA